MAKELDQELISVPPRSVRRRAGYPQYIFFCIFLIPHILVGIVLIINLFIGVLQSALGHHAAFSQLELMVFNTLPLPGRLIFALFWNGIIFVFLRHFILLPLRQRHLVRHGKTVVGRITGREVAQGKGITHYVSYEYALEAGPPLSGKMRVVEDDWNGAYMFLPITVLYDPKHPTRSVIYQYAPYQAL